MSKKIQKNNRNKKTSRKEPQKLSKNKPNNGNSLNSNVPSKKKSGFLMKLMGIDNAPQSAQQSIPYKEMFRDGICQVNNKLYTKTIEFEDINYHLAQNDAKTQIFEGWGDFLNYFDSSLSVQFSFINKFGNLQDFKSAIQISDRYDKNDGMRHEYTGMLENQLAKGNNGLVKTKYVTIGVEADSLKAAKQRIERVEVDVMSNFKTLGVNANPLTGAERLDVLHGQFNPVGGEKLLFDWDSLPKSGMSTKDFIAPTSFDFSDSGASGAGKTFRMGKTIGAVSFIQILAPELSDRLLADFLEMDTAVAVNIHIKSIDQAIAIKSIKRKMSDLDAMKIQEQKKAIRAGYDMDIIPTDLSTYGGEAKKLLEDLQSRNERMFLVTILVLNTAETKQKLENNIFAASSIAQKYNCAMKRLDYQQEQGLMSSVPLGLNQIEIKRALTTSSTAIFIPFTTQELFQGGEALYYGLNALSNNLIMANRKELKNPNGLFLGTPGCLTGDTKIRLANGSAATLAELYKQGGDIEVRCYNDVTGEVINAAATDARISGTTSELTVITLESGDTVRCTREHLILNREGEYVHAEDLREGDVLSGNHTVFKIEPLTLVEPMEVYDLTTERYMNFELDNGLIVHNSGKSFAAKREIVNVFLITTDDIIICDPEAEYFPLVEKLGGQVVKLSPTSEHHINPMDLNLNYSDDEHPLSLKSDFILSLCELIIGGKTGLKPVEKTIIDRCVRLVYKDYLVNPVPENMPILEDLYDLLRKQNEREARNIATALEIYVTGSLNVFNHRTNVDITNRLVSYDIKELGKSLKQIGMLILQDQVWGRVTANRAAHRTTWYYCDEFHLLLKEAQTASYCVEIWKRFRKWGGIPTALTQNVKDLLASREIENIFENSDFILMLNQAGGDRQILAKQLGISPYQLSYVTHSNAGEGLLFYGNTIIPFVDRFPKDTELYKIMTTKPSEIGENR